MTHKQVIKLLTKGTIILHYKNEGGDKLNEILKESFGATEKQTEEGYYYRDVRNLAGYRLALPTRTLPFDSYGMIFDKAGIIGLPDFYEYTSAAATSKTNKMTHKQVIKLDKMLDSYEKHMDARRKLIEDEDGVGLHEFHEALGYKGITLSCTESFDIWGQAEITAHIDLDAEDVKYLRNKYLTKEILYSACKEKIQELEERKTKQRDLIEFEHEGVIERIEKEIEELKRNNKRW